MNTQHEVDAYLNEAMSAVNHAVWAMPRIGQGKWQTVYDDLLDAVDALADAHVHLAELSADDEA